MITLLFRAVLPIGFAFMNSSIALSDGIYNEVFEVEIDSSKLLDLLPKGTDDFVEYNLVKPDGLPPRPCAIFRGQNIDCQTFVVNDSISGMPALVVGSKIPAPLPAVHPSLGILVEAYFTSGPVLANELMLDRLEGIAGALFGWTQANSVIDGSDVVKVWTEMAESGQPYSCTPATCSVVVFSTFNFDDNNYDGLAACVTYKIASTYSPPTKCNPILIRVEGRTLIVAVEAFFDYTYAIGGEVDFHIVFNNFSGEKLREDIEALVVGALKSEPLNLDVYRQAGQIIGSKKYTHLEQIGRWTMQTVRFSRSGVLFDEGNSLSMFEIATTLYVSAQNSASSNDWRLPSEAVASSYIDLLKRQFSESFESGCIRFDWKSEGKIIRVNCDKEK